MEARSTAQRQVAVKVAGICLQHKPISQNLKKDGRCIGPMGDVVHRISEKCAGIFVFCDCNGGVERARKMETPYILFFKSVGFSLELEETEASHVNETLEWHGWNCLAWHMRVFDAEDSPPVWFLWADGEPKPKTEFQREIFRYSLYPGKEWDTQPGFLWDALCKNGIDFPGYEGQRKGKKRTAGPDADQIGLFEVKSGEWKQENLLFLTPGVESKNIFRILGRKPVLKVYRESCEIRDAYDAVIKLEALGAPLRTPSKHSERFVLITETIESVRASENGGIVEVTPWERKFKVKRVAYCIGAESQSRLRVAVAWIVSVEGDADIGAAVRPIEKTREAVGRNPWPK
jgi:hypothetical protein